MDPEQSKAESRGGERDITTDENGPPSAHGGVAEKLTRSKRRVRRLQRQARYDEALAVALESHDLVRERFGEQHPEYAASLAGLAQLYRLKGNYAMAEPLRRQALEIRRSTFGEQHPQYAQSLGSLAASCREKGDYAAAEMLYRQVLQIQCSTLGEGHPRYAATLNNLAGLYHHKGDYTEAEPLYRQALEIRRSALGEKHPRYAVTLNDVAALYQRKGDYAAAEPLYRKALEIFRHTLGTKHPCYATSLNNLASLLHVKRDYCAAESLYRRALSIRRATLGERHSEYAASLDNLATVYRAKGDYGAAEPLGRQAVEVYRVALGERHPEYATSLDNLAALYCAKGDLAAAEPLYRHAWEIRRSALGEQHPGCATSISHLVTLHLKKGEYAAAEPLCHRALEIRRSAVGEQHPLYARSLRNLALLYAATARQDDALSLMERASAIEDRMVGQIFSTSSEAQRAAFLEDLRRSVHMLLSLVLQRLPRLPATIGSALDLVLRRKAIGAEAVASQRDAVLTGRHARLRPKLEELAALRRRIAGKALAGPGPEGRATHDRQLEIWEAERGRLEAELAAAIPEVNLERQLRTADRRAVASALTAGTALVEFMRFDEFDFKAVPARGDERWKPARYAAFVLHAGRPDDVRMVDLGEAEPIDRLIHAFREQIICEGGRRRDVAAEACDPGLAGVPDDEGRALSSTVFEPLMHALGDCTRLLLAPDGDLARLPFEVLPANTGRLIDEYQIGYLATGRDVLRLGTPSTGEAAEPLVVADPDFDLAGDRSRPAEYALAMVNVSRDLDRGRFHFGRLPGTEQEGKQVAAMLDVRPWVAGAALEARLKASRSPRILHLATHGFFLADQQQDLESEGRGLGTFEDTDNLPGRLAGPLPENPLLRSGLGLAGVNTWLRGGTPPEEAEDGLLTAEDVTGMDLLDTELVVLSACETGLGEVKVGEGVFGLRRAFVLAGAKTLVMSLWKVPDEQTRELMEEFYRRLLAGAGRADALREAQLALRKKHPHPYYWGAFICQGDPGPLRRTIESVGSAAKG